MSLNTLFNLPEKITPPASTNIVARDTADVRTDLEADFDLARENLQEIAKISQEATQEWAGMSKQLQDGRAYSTLSKLIAVSVLANKGLIELHKGKVEVNEIEKPVEPTTVNNTVMIGTTAELQALLAGMKPDEVDFTDANGTD